MLHAAIHIEMIEYLQSGSITWIYMQEFGSKMIPFSCTQIIRFSCNEDFSQKTRNFWQNWRIEPVFPFAKLCVGNKGALAHSKQCGRPSF